MSSSTTTPPVPSPAPDPVVTEARKALEDDAKAHINTIWQKIEDAVEWPVEKLEALIADLKKHV